MKDIYFELRSQLELLQPQFKEAPNSFSFFQTNQYTLSLDTVRVIILRRNLAKVLSTHRRILTLYFPPKNVTMATILGISLGLIINIYCLI